MGQPAMESIDHFFELYERLMPEWFGDAFVAAVLVGLPLLVDQI